MMLRFSLDCIHLNSQSPTLCHTVVSNRCLLLYITQLHISGWNVLFEGTVKIYVGLLLDVIMVTDLHVCMW